MALPALARCVSIAQVLWMFAAAVIVANVVLAAVLAVVGVLIERGWYRRAEAERRALVERAWKPRRRG